MRKKSHNKLVYEGDIDKSLLCHFRILFSLLLLLVLVSSCAVYYYPQPSESVSIVDGYAVLQSDGFSLAIIPRPWSKEPQKVNDYFTTYYVVVINQTSEIVSIQPENITLLDDERNQYDVLLYDDVIDILVRDDFFFERYHSFGEPFPSATDDRMRGRAQLMQESYHYGDILPNARKSGYIYFKKVPARNQKNTVVVKGKEIIFIKK